ncbi:MAG: hypothetical protein JO190_08910 [Candidatus Eremiobacteraeota bacterium]|nr:hypothetical protein [Candidatus Eremiobacteraeota bacterium]MBV8498122.1 hypothetical protein [Candidatus Eremiobacteraeota bacterium]
MKVSLASLLAAIVLVGCGNGVALWPGTSTNVGARTISARSWMDPAAKAEARLLYVSTFPFRGTAGVEVYSWDHRTNVGELTGVENPRHLCSDKAGNVFVPDSGKKEILKYAHGGTSPIAILKDAGRNPWACSSDPVSGDLAVADGTIDGVGGDIAIYRKASGKPTRYTDPRFASYVACGYDDAGNLFIDGTRTTWEPLPHAQFAEIFKGSTSFTEITLNRRVAEPGSVQWDGKDVAVGDGDVVYRFKIMGSTGTFQGSTDLFGGNGPVHQFWIPRFGRVNAPATRIVAGQYHFFPYEPGDVGFWAYPHAGPPLHLLMGPDHPDGVTVSEATK